MQERDKSTDRWDLPALNRHPFTPLQYCTNGNTNIMITKASFIDWWWDDMFVALPFTSRIQEQTWRCELATGTTCSTVRGASVVLQREGGVAST
jgi:hypothetical protein